MATWVSGFGWVVWGCWLLWGEGGGLATQRGWMMGGCAQRSVWKPSKATSLSEWIWLGCVCVCVGGGGGGRCESVWLYKEDGGWVDVLGEVCGNHQWLPHWVSGFGWVCVCGGGGGGGAGVGVCSTKKMEDGNYQWLPHWANGVGCWWGGERERSVEVSGYTKKTNDGGMCWKCVDVAVWQSEWGLGEWCVGGGGNGGDWYGCVSAWMWVCTDGVGTWMSAAVFGDWCGCIS